jgi:hypothetical protein
MSLNKIDWEGVNWIHLARDRDRWWYFSNTVMNYWLPKKKFEKILDQLSVLSGSEEWFCSMELVSTL